MNPTQVSEAIGTVPHMDLFMGEIATRHIIMWGLKRILEIGIMHGASTCFFAAAADRLEGQVTSIDLEYTSRLEPNAEILLSKCGLTKRSRIFRENHNEGGEWRLLKLIEAGEVFDFAYIDGSHLWRDVAADFIMVDRLIRPGGWILFDDINWCVNQGTNPNADWCKHWTAEMKASYQPKAVWTHLVKHHPSYFNFTEPFPNWGLCQKKPI